MTQGNFRVGVSYESDPKKVKELIRSELQGMNGLAATPAPAVLITEYGESAIHYMIYFWVVDVTQVGNVKDALATTLWSAFRREGIEIPYPMRTVRLQQSIETARGDDHPEPGV